MAELTPTSPIAQRVVRRVRRAIGGNSQIISADLAGLSPTVAPEKTTLGDDPALRQLLKHNRLQKQLWADDADVSRARRYRDFRSMYDRVPELKRILKLIVAMVFGGEPALGRATAAQDRRPFEIDVTASASDEVRECVENTAVALSLFQLIPQMFQSGQMLGDAFLELVSSLVEVVASKPLPAGDTRVIWNEYCQLIGYQVGVDNRSGFGASAGQGSGKALHPLYVVHYAPERRFGHRYGESLYHSLRSVERQFLTGVDLIHVLMILQGAQRRTATIPVPRGWSEPQIRNWLQKIKLWNSDTTFFDSAGDFHKSVAGLLDYSDKLIPVRDGQAAPTFHNDATPPFEQLLSIVKFDQNRFYVGTGVPKAFAGHLDDAHSRAALTAQGMEFAKQLRFYQQDAAVLTLDILIRACLIAEVDVQPGDIVVRMNTLSEFNEQATAEVLKLRAQAAQALKLINVPMRWILEQVIRVPGADIEDMMIEIGQAPDEPETQMPENALAAQVIAALGDQVERAREAVLMLKPVVATIADLAERHEPRKTP